MGIDLACDPPCSRFAGLHRPLHRIMDCQVLPTGSDSDFDLDSRLAVRNGLRSGMDRFDFTLAVEALSEPMGGPPITPLMADCSETRRAQQVGALNPIPASSCLTPVASFPYPAFVAAPPGSGRAASNVKNFHLRGAHFEGGT